jgi:major membrane immunogen (membrane-anchored lipoprotein)
MKTKHLLINVVLLATLLLASCVSSDDVRVGELRTESKSVELGDARSVRAKMVLGAGDLVVTGGAKKLLEADFAYNVAKLKPEVEFTDGTLVVQHPDVRGYRIPQDIKDFRNEWDLRLNNDVPMNLSLEMGAGTSDLKLAGLSLTGLDIKLGAGKCTVDLSGDWTRDLDAAIQTGAANVTVILPKDVGVRVEVDSGPTAINAPDLKQDGNVYTNEAYGTSDVTLHINMQTGIGRINLEAVE